MREAVVVEAVRTPIGKRNGALSSIHAADLSALVLTELAKRTGIEPDLVDDVVWGCVSQIGDQSSNIGRFAVLAAGWPEIIPATTVNRPAGPASRRWTSPPTPSWPASRTSSSPAGSRR